MGFRDRIAELFEADDPEPKGTRNSSTDVISGSFERNRPPKDEMQKYWRMYETMPLVREPISAFAREVVEPGWYIEAESEETREELTEWLQEAAIIEGEKGKDVTLLFRKVIIQREVRGTALVEKVTDSQDEYIVAVYLHNPEEFEVITHPNTNILPDPDDNINLDDHTRGTKPKTDSGETGAYIQFDSERPRWSRRSEQGKDTDIVFTKDEIIKLTRDADVGEVFGTSRIESVAPRVEALHNKLDDNDAAIASKAYPFWLFQFGTDEEPWDEDDVQNFMKHHDIENFRPDMKQGVAGDVDIKTISGDVAEIGESISYDVDHIITGMPMPKFALGAFSENVNQYVATSQENRIRRQVREARRELEAEFTPVLEEVAEERGLDTENLRLKIGIPGEEDRRPEDDNVLRYVSDSPQGGDDDGEENPAGGDVRGDMDDSTPTSSPGTDDGGTGAPTPSSGDGEEASVTLSERHETYEGVWDNPLPKAVQTGSEAVCADGECNTDELADPRFISIRDVRPSLRGDITDIFREIRDETFDTLEAQADGDGIVTDPDIDPAQIVQRIESSARLRETANTEMENIIKKTLDRLDSNNHSPRISTLYGPEHDRRAGSHAELLTEAVESAGHDLVSRIVREARRAGMNGESIWDAEGRLDGLIREKPMRQRADLIARMELRSAIEATKLHEYRNGEEVVGYRVINPCTDSTTPLCERLAGCGTHDGVEVSFDGGESSQLHDHVSDEHLFAHFDPLPTTPPYHWGCRSSIVPVSAD